MLITKFHHHISQLVFIIVSIVSSNSEGSKQTNWTGRNLKVNLREQEHQYTSQLICLKILGQPQLFYQIKRRPSLCITGWQSQGRWLIFKMNADEFKNLPWAYSIKEQFITIQLSHSTEVYSRMGLNGSNKRTVDRFE